MNEILHANIFFLIASIATVVFCILVSLILFQVLKIVKSLRAIMERIEAGSEQIVSDVTQVRELIASGGMFSRAISFIMGSAFGRGGKRRKSRDED